MSQNPKKERVRKCINCGNNQFIIITNTTRGGNCDCHTESDCRTDIKDCKFDKKTCLKRRAKNDRRKRFPLGTITIIVGVALLVILYLINRKCPNPIPESIMNMLTGLLVSIIAAGLFTLIIDIRNRLQENMQSVIDAITDHSYLTKLDDWQLTKLRKQVTHELHAKDAPNAAKDLIHIDEKICKLLKKPYYERYVNTITGNIFADNNSFRRKQITIDYELVNPCGEHRPTAEYIGFQILVFKDETLKEPVKDIKIKCDIDGQGYKDYSGKIEINISPLDREVEYYNHCVTVIEKGVPINPNRTKNGLKIDYNNKINVTISYTLITPKEDNCFSKLMRHPTKTLLVDYTDLSSNVELFGHMIGTELEYSDVHMTYKDKDKSSLMLNSRNKWLLPNEGVLIVSSPKKDK